MEEQQQYGDHLANRAKKEDQHGKRKKAQNASDTPKKKRKEAKKEPKKQPEKRLARYRSKLTNAIAERIDRAMPGSGHRLFLVDHAQLRPETDPNGPASSFTIMGATGNIYTTTIDHIPTCTCPDFQRRGGPCKHLLFVTLRVLNLNHTDMCVIQQALLTEELKHVLGNMETRVLQAPRVVVADEAVRSVWKQRAGASSSSTTPVKPRNVDEGAECGICFDPLTNDSVCCVQCQNGLHQACWNALLKHKKSSNVPCPYCRGDFMGGRAEEGGYVNLASVSTAHRGHNVGLLELYPNSAE